MDLYLVNKFKGTYRVLAHYDTSTNDFIRDHDGNLDSDFADFYLKGRGGIEIKHGYGSELFCYIPKLQLGNNILKSYYEAMIGDCKNKSMDKIVKDLQDHGYVTDVDILSAEVMFGFDVKYIDKLDPIVKIKKSGANISPFSVRNLPSTPYKIPKSDMDYYKECKGELTGLEIGRLQDKFIKKFCDSDFKTKMKKEMLKANQYIHKIGKWNEYCEYIKKDNHGEG